MAKNYDDEGLSRASSPRGEEDAVGEFLQRRRDRAYEEFMESRADAEDYIGSRRSSAARHVITEGRVRGGESADKERNAPSHTAQTSKRYTQSNNKRENNKNSRQRNKKSGLGRAVRVICLLLVVLLAAYYVTMGVLTADVVRADADTSQPVAPVSQVSDIEARGDTLLCKNVLLLGIDADGKSGARSDTMMIASINMADGSIGLCSILRDNYVTIPGRSGKNRINAAYAYGGAQLALQTVEANYRMDIDRYVSVNMTALRHIVDAIGGVEITITDAEAVQINTHSASDTRVSGGTQRLDGRQAVCYARIRKIDSDFGRTNRQRVLIGAIVAQCRTLPITELLGLVETVSPYLTTNMTSAEIATLALQALPCLAGDFRQLSLPVSGTFTYETIDGMEVIVSDLSENTRALHEFIYG